MNYKKISAVLAVSIGLLAGSLTTQADTSGQTQHPIVLVHGHSGFDSVLADYFYGVKSALSGVGATPYTPQVPGWESNEERGEVLLAYVEDLVATTGASKVNLVGHSQGGTTSRYVAAVRPDLVASVTSIATPHFGSPVADVIKDSPLEGVALTLGNAIGTFMAVISGDRSQSVNAMGSLESINTQGAADFNALYPQAVRDSSCRSVPSTNVGSWWWPRYVKDYSVNDGDHVVNGVSYYSWTGTYSAIWDSNVLDPADAFLGITSLMHSEENDGLVARCSTHMGKVIRDDYTQNHADEINGMFGLLGLWTTSPVPLYVEHARRLKNAGL